MKVQLEFQLDEPDYTATEAFKAVQNASFTPSLQPVADFVNAVKDDLLPSLCLSPEQLQKFENLGLNATSTLRETENHVEQLHAATKALIKALYGDRTFY